MRRQVYVCPACAAFGEGSPPHGWLVLLGRRDEGRWWNEYVRERGWLP